MRLAWEPAAAVTDNVTKDDAVLLFKIIFHQILT